MAADLDLVDAHAGPIAPADLILIFGTRHWTPADIAAELYFDGFAPMIVTTGGAARHPRGRSEAVVHQQLLLAAGVPAEAILVESQSTNTVENVTLALPLMGKPRSVIAVVKWNHRRALVTLAAHAPWIERIYAADYEPYDAVGRVYLSRSNWRATYADRVERETRYLLEMRTAGFDLLRRTDAGWVRSELPPEVTSR